MESKTKHRILGVVVVAGLAILAYPFIQGSGNAPGEQALVKAPPFPDQAVQVSSTETLASVEQPDAMSPAAPDAAPPSLSPTPDANTASPAQQSSDSSTQGDVNIVNIASPNAASTDTTPPAADSTPPQESDNQSAQPDAAPVSPLENAPTDQSAVTAPTPDADKVQTSPSANTIDNQRAVPVKSHMTDNSRAAHKNLSVKSAHHKKFAKAQIKKQPVLLSKLTSAAAIKANRHKPLNSNGLLQLKKSAWVIQLGSFKEKSNALRLVNKLRAGGYRAFIQHVSGHSGQSTRVFVGPEHQQASARIVASELEKNLKLHGIVISYKPFSL